MSDKVYAFTVVLDDVINTDEADAIIAAISLIRGVAEVVPLVATSEVYYAETRARTKLIEKIWRVLRGKEDGYG